jgi:uncharacterized protein (DUF433 family)
MAQQELKPFKDCRWIVADPGMLGGKLAIRGARFSVSFILACLADRMTIEEVEETYGSFPHESIPEMMKAAADLLEAPNVVA